MNLKTQINKLICLGYIYVFIVNIQLKSFHYTLFSLQCKNITMVEQVISCVILNLAN